MLDIEFFQHFNTLSIKFKYSLRIDIYLPRSLVYQKCINKSTHRIEATKKFKP